MRRLYEDLVDDHFRDARQMFFLMGPRQVGKTTTSRKASGPRQRKLYLNWDNFDHQTIITAGPGRIADELRLDVLSDEKPLLVLDEIHKYPLWRTFLKGFFDTHGDGLDILVTGSARLSVFNAGSESLMGRYFGYRMHPLSLAELVAPEVGPPPGERQPATSDDDLLETLLRFGGFPEPLLKGDTRFALRWRRLRHQQLMREEIRDLTRIQEIAKVQMLAQLIAQRVGQLTSYSTLANHIDASIDSVKRWLQALDSLYFCFALRPWFKNVTRSLRKEPKLYLWDWSMIEDPGARFENLVACALLKSVHLWTDHGCGTYELWFLRDKQKREVDFLISRDGQPWILVEAKSSHRAGLSAHLAHFHAQLATTSALQVALDLPYVERDCFTLERPIIVPARTLLSQLV